jgi:hypothetical protein
MTVQSQFQRLPSTSYISLNLSQIGPKVLENLNQCKNNQETLIDVAANLAGFNASQFNLTVLIGQFLASYNLTQLTGQLNIRSVALYEGLLVRRVPARLTCLSLYSSLVNFNGLNVTAQINGIQNSGLSGINLNQFLNLTSQASINASALNSVRFEFQRFCGQVDNVFGASLTGVLVAEYIRTKRKQLLFCLLESSGWISDASSGRQHHRRVPEPC